MLNEEEDTSIYKIRRQRHGFREYTTKYQSKLHAKSPPPEFFWRLEFVFEASVFFVEPSC
jgi:hypothetical protein